MKKIILGILIIAIPAMHTFAACIYNFDANQTQLNAVSSGSLPFPTISGQKVSLTISPTTGSKRYVAASGNFGNKQLSQPGKMIGDVALSQSNIIAYEMIVKVPNVVLSNNSIIGLFPFTFFGTKEDKHVLSNSIMSLNNIPEVPNQILSAWQSRDLSNSALIGENAIDNNALNNGVRLGFYINQQTQQIGVISNGTNYGYVGSYSTKPNEGYFLAQIAVQDIPSNSAMVGKTFSLELVTDRTKLQNTYPTGAKDICGNTI
ncbi:DUF4882 family protein [Acinetobacter gyllenbergii]|uniref:DUF4882 family protein n=1 Tax=Acinetobacter gyllenbergii TaxID=134534 RepID=UPI0003BFA71B|nr:DUF4882 family protein [Acinetobacter gyllenbergii]ESK56992.1 hypothetical protein F987_00274 [Acinetobacter gyllenbergii NIPH 230]